MDSNQGFSLFVCTAPVSGVAGEFESAKKMVKTTRSMSSTPWEAVFRRSHLILTVLCALVCLTEAEEPVPWNIAGCGTRNSSVTNLVGRNAMQRGVIPWVASIYQSQGMRYKHVCAGAILNERYVVTAANCLKYPKRPGRYIIYTGLDKRKRKFLEYRQPVVLNDVQKLWIHPEYNSTTNANNIALFKTHFRIDMNDNANAICLPHTSEDPSGTAYVAGWGHTNRNGKSNPHVLQSTQVFILPREKCNDFYWNGGIMESEFCTEPENKRSCQNDYGSPMVQQADNGTYFLIGIASFNVGCKEDSNLGIYTRVTSHLDWLTDKMIGYRPRKFGDRTRLLCNDGDRDACRSVKKMKAEKKIMP